MDHSSLSKRIRDTLQLSQADLAELLGMHQPDISRVEGGHDELPPAKLRRLQVLVECSKSIFGIYKMLTLEFYENRLLHDPQLH